METWLGSILTAIAALAAAFFGLFSGVMLFGCGPRTAGLQMGIVAADALAVGTWFALRRVKAVRHFSLRAVGYAFVAGLTVGMFAP